MGCVLVLGIVLALSVAPPASANPILMMPTGTTLTTGQFRLEGAFSPKNEHGKYFWFVTGVMQFEASLIRNEQPGVPAENLVSAQWCFIPETFITPAVSFGVRDVASQSKEGAAGYLAITKSVPIERLVPAISDFRATIGAGVGGFQGPFAGFETKLPFNFFMEGEYDTRDFNGAFGWQPVSMFRVKAYSIRSDFYVGAELLPVAF